jgi:hypothetical protein
MKEPPNRLKKKSSRTTANEISGILTELEKAEDGKLPVLGNRR